MDKQLFNIMNESINFILSDADNIIINHFDFTHVYNTKKIINITRKNYRLFCKFVFIINDEVNDYVIACDKCHNDDNIFNMSRFSVTRDHIYIVYDICPNCISSYIPNTYLYNEIEEEDIYKFKNVRGLIDICNNTSKLEECIICYDKKMTYELFTSCHHSVCFDCFINIDKQTCYYKCNKK